MSSAGSAAAKVAQQTYRNAKTARERWIIKEVPCFIRLFAESLPIERTEEYSWKANKSTCMQAYPLYATIGLGCVGAVFYLGRLALGPDTLYALT